MKTTQIHVDHLRVGDFVIVKGYGKERPSGLAIEFRGTGALPVVGVKDYVNVEVPATEFCGHNRIVTVPKCSIVEARRIDRSGVTPENWSRINYLIASLTEELRKVDAQ